MVVEGKTAEVRIGQEVHLQSIIRTKFFMEISKWNFIKEISYDKQQNNDGISSEIEVIYDTSVNLIKYPKGYDSQETKSKQIVENADKPEDSLQVNIEDFYILTTKLNTICYMIYLMIDLD